MTTQVTPATADKRTRLVESAAKLTYEQGFHRTTLADISRDSGVPLGNVYYYFKTKEAIADALIDRFVARYGERVKQWEAKADPKARIESFIQMTVENRDSLARSGCPVGTLCSELRKEGGAVADRAATVFENMLRWLEAQFLLLGKRNEAPGLAVHVVSALEGASLLANTFNDPRYVVREANRLKGWVRSL
jgi:TetR/AcrR family transcriptional regulator, transcriptional repressor for nem operon